MKNVRGGITLVELLVVAVILIVCVGLLLPATRSSREAARRMSCSNNFRQIGLAFHNYHSNHTQLPQQMGGTFDQRGTATRPDGDATNGYRLSALTGLLPFLEQTRLWESISKGKDPRHPAASFAPMGPAPWKASFSPWRTKVPTFRCPSDPGVSESGFARTNYAVCLGDAIDALDTGPVRWDERSRNWFDDRGERVAVSGRGLLIPRKPTRWRDALDGLSNTLLAGEITTDLNDGDIRTVPSLSNPKVHDEAATCRHQIDPRRPRYWLSSSPQADPIPSIATRTRGSRWADGAALYTGFNTLLPPNSEACMAEGPSGIGTLSASSRHQGGAHVLFADGAVAFLTDSIDCGDSYAGPVVLDGSGPRAANAHSPYGLWGALGTRACGELIEEQLNQ